MLGGKHGLWILSAGILGLAYFFRQPIASGAQAAMNSPAFTRWDSVFQKMGRTYGVPWRWIKAVAMNESNLGQAKSVARGLAAPWDAEGSKSSDGLSWGIMQTTLATSRELEGSLVTEAYLNEPENSIRLGTKYLRKMIDRFGIRDRENVIRSYNGGPGWAKTKMGPTWTATYYAKFLANLATVMAKQPGDELEGYR